MHSPSVARVFHKRQRATPMRWKQCAWGALEEGKAGQKRNCSFLLEGGVEREKKLQPICITSPVQLSLRARGSPFVLLAPFFSHGPFVAVRAGPESGISSDDKSSFLRKCVFDDIFFFFFRQRGRVFFFSFSFCALLASSNFFFSHFFPFEFLFFFSHSVSFFFLVQNGVFC